MCELLGLAFNQPILPSLSFRGFRHGAAGNPHGWGLACFPDGSTQIFKEPVPGDRSRLADFVRDYAGVRSKVLIGHVRRHSVGETSLANTHPFCREVRGRHLVLAHNGTMGKHRLEPMLDGTFTPVGTTDSEFALCALATWILDSGVSFEAFGRIHERLREMNLCGDMNLLFSDGCRLYAYFDAGGHNGLCYVRRQAPFGSVCLQDEDWEVDLGAEKRPEQRGYVVASRPLTDERWQEFERGGLLVFQDGALVYPN